MNTNLYWRKILMELVAKPFRIQCVTQATTTFRPHFKTNLNLQDPKKKYKLYLFKWKAYITATLSNRTFFLSALLKHPSLGYWYGNPRRFRWRFCFRTRLCWMLLLPVWACFARILKLHLTLAVYITIKKVHCWAVRFCEPFSSFSE